MRISEEQVHQMMMQAIEAAGSQKNFAQACGISEQYLSDIVARTRPPAEKVLSKLGIEKKVVYELVEEK